MTTYTKYTYLSDAELLRLVDGEAAKDLDYVRELVARLALRLSDDEPPLIVADYQHYGVNQ